MFRPTTNQIYDDSNKKYFVGKRDVGHSLKPGQEVFSAKLYYAIRVYG